jgi:hypothetical protein
MMRKGKIVKTVAETAFLFGLIIFLYVVGVSYFQPYWLDKQVTHLQEGVSWLTWLTNDILGIIAFIVSVCGFMVMRYLSSE